MLLCAKINPISPTPILLETIVDPVNAALREAPNDDEPESEEERQAVAEARDWLKSGKVIPHDEAMRKLGLG